MLKRITVLLLCLMLVIPSVTAYAWNGSKNEGLKEVEPGETTDLEGQDQALTGRN